MASHKEFFVYAAAIPALSIKYTKPPWETFHINRKLYKFGSTTRIKKRWESYEFNFIPVEYIDFVELETRKLMRAAEMLIHNYDRYNFPPHRLTSVNGKVLEFFLLNQDELKIKLLRFIELRTPAFLEKLKTDADAIIKEGPKKMKVYKRSVNLYCDFNLYQMPIQMELELWREAQNG